ncbi:N-acetylmuramoyl-L-alanine amidase [Rhodococcus tibetensis]|uniref:N-acetylmuramoyl-L-alanine amidase n=1 Tax=Rhodococcus tibetensis TaxID=2965064 RepID=A0ABT1QE11_9NOCA|nr:N-acetylmuramoyl-L-alanine amidase [Rhodococcus sp. FXJ9.536]MCQ4120516.1 N-acetylmuramoyl-L-alanine amidase [Rhodococcus sp. FXJ9.536]
MPHRRPKPSIVLGAVAALAVASPVAVYGISSAPSDVRSTNETSASAVSTEIAQVVLSQIPDIVIPLKELTGLNLPDVNIGDLRNVKIPPYIQIPSNLPLPAGIQIPNLQIPLKLPAPGDVSDPAILPPADQQPGAIVKEITRDTPFSMVALTSETVASAESKVRALQADGTWGDWFSPDMIDTRRTDKTASNGTVATEPVYVGLTKAIQILTPTTGLAHAAEPVPAPAQPATPAAPSQPAPPAAPAPEVAAPLGYAPASINTPLRQQPAQTGADDVTAVLIEPGSGPGDGALSDIATPIGGSGPKVITRAQWGADESIRCDEPTYDDFIGGATVHHTAGTNDYSKAESAEIVRAIYAYHAQTLGWCDVGYNVLVDKYGQIFEGRAGGLDRPVQGAHAGGFNENTTGIAMMGDFSSEDPPQATIDSVGKFLGWKLAKAGLDPLGKTTMYSEGTEFTPYAQGEAVDLPVIFAHRDVGNTSCPGDAGYSHMDEIRRIAAANTGGGDSASLASGPPAGEAPAASAPGTDASASLGSGIPALVNEILRLTDPSPVAQKWVAEGGDTGPLGQAVTGLLQAKAGNQGAQFTNGAIYTSPNGGVWSVLGQIFKTWQNLGADNGELGLPTSDEYPIPGGLRTDFENGSLIFNELTGIVTKVLKTYNDAYAEAYRNGAPVDAAAPAAPPADPAQLPPAPAPAPVEPAPAPAAPAPAPAPAG